MKRSNQGIKNPKSINNQFNSFDSIKNKNKIHIDHVEREYLEEIAKDVIRERREIGEVGEVVKG